MSIMLLLLAAGITLITILVLVIAYQNREIGESSQSYSTQTSSSVLTDNLRQEILNWLQRGRKIEAIKAYRIATNAGLKEAKEAVEAIERGENPRYRASAPIPTANWRAQIEEMLRQNRKIEAIKIYRQATNTGLKDAKDAVDAIEKEILTP